MNLRPIYVENEKEVSIDSNEKRNEEKKLNATLTTSEDPLLSVQTIFPFDFFQDKVVVDTTKITIIRKKFIAMYQVESFLIKDLVTVVLETSLFFASIKFVDRFFSKEPSQVEYLNKNDAEKLRRIIHGLMVVKTENIQVDKLQTETLSGKLEQLGSAVNSESSDIKM